jgi:hypothetical protein
MIRRLTLGLAAAVALAACGGNRQADMQPRTILRVENQSTLDVNIHLIAGSQRVRIGTANALGTSRITIPSHFVFGVSGLRFLADPIGRNRAPVSEVISVAPGDEVRVIIPIAADMVQPAGMSLRRIPIS